MKICPVCESALFDDMDTCFGCLYRFGSDPALEAARSATVVPWPAEGEGARVCEVEGGNGGDGDDGGRSADAPAREMSVPGWRLRVRSEGLQPRGSSLTIEIEPV